MGPGWQAQLVLAAGLFGLFVAGLKIMAHGVNRRDHAARPDALLALWHRYEEGDLTRPEFERARRSLREATSGHYQSWPHLHGGGHAHAS